MTRPRNLRQFTVISAVVALLACSCARPHDPSDLKASIASIRRYAESFEGLDAKAVRRRLAGAQLSEEEWNEGEFGGKQVVATFPEYEVRVFLAEGKTITTSVQILSK